jgi:hypothetical protein
VLPDPSEKNELDNNKNTTTTKTIFFKTEDGELLPEIRVYIDGEFYVTDSNASIELQIKEGTYISRIWIGEVSIDMNVVLGADSYQVVEIPKNLVDDAKAKTPKETSFTATLAKSKVVHITTGTLGLTALIYIVRWLLGLIKGRF